MAKYSKKAQEKVERSMHEMHEGKLKSGSSGKRVTNPKQAIAIGLSEAREAGAKVPRKAAAKKGVAKKQAPKKQPPVKQPLKKLPPKKQPPKKQLQKKQHLRKKTLPGKRQQQQHRKEYFVFYLFRYTKKTGCHAAPVFLYGISLDQFIIWTNN